MKRRAFLGGLGGAAGGIALAPAFALAAPAARNQIFGRLRDAAIDVRSRAELTSARSAVSSEAAEVVLAARPGRQISRDGKLTVGATPPAGHADAIDVVSSLRLGSSSVTQLLVALDFRTWSRNNYVVLPGACYAGNRFQSRRAAAYPPLLTERADIGPHVPPIIPDIPHLAVGDGASSLTLEAGDLATPAVGIFVPASRLGIIVMTDVETAIGRTTLTVQEAADRTRASVVVGTRRSLGPPPAHPHSFAPARPGVGTQLAARVFAFECADIPALHERLFELRKDVTGKTALVNELPFSAAFALHEQRAAARWVEKPGFLAVGDRSSAYSTWQTGWCGGLVTTFPLLAAGGKQSRERAAATIAFALEGGQALSGFFHGISDGKTWTEDGFAAPLPAPAADSARPPAAPVYKQARRWHLVRRTAEALTFLVKQIALLERRPELRAGSGKGERWAEAARLSAEALVKLWERNKQLGQFVDVETGELIVGGSTSAGLAPAGLALAAAQLKEPRYLQAARAIGEHYYERFVRIGLTCGGPGDALQAPDSQSAAALLDSFMTLFEATRDRVWVDRARAAAHLLASWVVAHDRPAAPPGCLDPDLRAAGAVLWSACAGRGSPGYLLSSGDALFRLYRATGDATLLDLLRDTVHNLAQYLPLAGGEPAVAEGDKPLADCARAARARWLDRGGGVVPVEGVFDTIGLLSYTEVPGIYARVDTGFLFVFDHVTARIKDRQRGRLVLAIANPTRTDAAVRILSETAAAAEEPLKPGAVLDAQTALIPAGGTLEVTVPAG